MGKPLFNIRCTSTIEIIDRLFEAIREVPDVVRVVRGSMRLLKRKGTHAFWAMALPDSEDDSPPSAPPLGI